MMEPMATSSPQSSSCFQIPADIYNDVLYCQKMLRTHIKVHQKIVRSLMMESSPAEDPRLQFIENEITAIGDDQHIVLQRLRSCINAFCQQDPFANRPNILFMISDCFKSKALIHNTTLPMTVQRRRCESELRQLLAIDTQSRPQSPIEVTTTPPPAIEASNNGADKMDVLFQPMGISPTFVNGSASRQQSLLKPKSERVSWPNVSPVMANDEKPDIPSVTTTPPANGLNHSRMRLQQALKNAHVQKKSMPPAAAPVVSPNIPIPSMATKTTTTLSPARASLAPLSSNQSASLNSSPITSDDNSTTSCSSASRTQAVIQKRPKKTQRVAPAKRARSGKSPSPTSSSGDSNDLADLPEEDEESTTLGKEAFMRVFGLCTQNYYTFLKQRRSERKRRNVTSTEKRDFHYGKLDLYEQQHRQSNKNNKRPVLYSPPQTRGVRLRKPTSAAIAGQVQTGGASSKATTAAGQATKAAAAALVAKKAANNKKSYDNSPELSDDASNNMCMSCTTTTREKLLECESCNAFFHITCHKTASIMAAAAALSQSAGAGNQSAVGRDQYCPDCLRRRNYIGKAK